MLTPIFSLLSNHFQTKGGMDIFWNTIRITQENQQNGKDHKNAQEQVEDVRRCMLNQLGLIRIA